MKLDIILSGVGGQGILSIAAIIGEAALRKGLHVKQAEVHGMSQRGGSVVTYVRYGGRVDSPIVDKGQADVILSFEQLEAARYLTYLKPDGTLLTNTQQIDPMPVVTGAAVYPQNLIEKMKTAGVKILALDALTLAKKAGSVKAINVALLGVLSNYMPFSEDIWREAISACVPPRFLEVNQKAFALGRAYREV